MTKLPISFQENLEREKIEMNKYLYICSQWLAISKASNDKKTRPGLNKYPIKMLRYDSRQIHINYMKKHKN